MSTRRGGLVPVLLALVMVLVLPGLVLADDGDGMVVMGTPVTIGPNEVHQGDVVSLGGSVEVAGEVSGDVVAVGDSIRVDGTVDGDVTAIGGPVSLGPHAVVRGDVNAIGGTLSRAPGAQVLGRTSSGFRFGLHLIPDLPRFAPYLTPTWGGWRWPGVGRYFLYVAG
ncbi:MAG TPA: polymer-forming cytoskeletal protein, partial [Thermaerobacter sp.]